MMKRPNRRKIHLLFLLCIAFAGLASQTDNPAPSKLEIKASEALAYNRKHNLNTDFCILVDMGIHSGKKRLFVWDFQQNKMIKSGMVSHGCCQFLWGTDATKDKVKFSNVPDSHCSSVGKYKLGKRGYSNWGIHINYKMHGLESSNNKAYERFIVLHSLEAVSDEESYPKGTPEGWGCPAVSNQFMHYLDNKLKTSGASTLFWIYQ